MCCNFAKNLNEYTFIRSIKINRTKVFLSLNINGNELNNPLSKIK